MASNRGDTDPARDAHEDRPKRGDVAEPDTTQAEEWGERIDTGRTIARGGKENAPAPRDGKQA